MQNMQYKLKRYDLNLKIVCLKTKWLDGWLSIFGSILIPGSHSDIFNDYYIWRSYFVYAMISIKICTSKKYATSNACL